MKHIIDGEDLERLQTYGLCNIGFYDVCIDRKTSGKYVRLDAVLALLAQSPVADGMVLEISDEKLHELICEYHPKAQKCVKRFEITDWWRFGKAVSKAMLSAYKGNE